MTTTMPNRLRCCQARATISAMKSSMRVAVGLLIAGIVVGVFGGVLGFAPIHRAGISCGSALKPDTNAAEVADMTRAIEADSGLGTDSDLSATSNACDAAVSDRKPIAWGLVGVAGLLVVAALVGFGVASNQFTPSKPQSDEHPMHGAW